MSRFSNLEFGQEPEGAPRQHSAGRDEQRCLDDAQTAFEQADFESALRAFSKVLEFNPHNTVAWAGQVRALVELGEFNEAKLWADKALERFPDAPELLAAKAVALARLGDTDAAITFSDAAVEAQQGDTPYVWLARGDVLLAREEKRADFCFDKALALAPGDWFVTWLAARVRAFYRQFAHSLKLVQQALALKPDHTVLWLMAGQCQQELGLVAAARDSYGQVLQLDPRRLEARDAIQALENTGFAARIAAWWRRRNSK
jgi:tetratricopeptide (TPR) repeat protein